MMEPMVPYWPMYGTIYTTSEFESVFFDCIKDGNIDWLDSARTDIRMNLNTRNDQGETPLLFAIRNAPEDKKTQLVNMILSPLHVLVDFDDKNGNTPLHEAILQDNPEIILALLYKHADINQNNSNDISPLDLLNTNNCPEIKHMLKNNAPKWLQQGEDYQTLYTIRKATEHSSNISSTKKIAEDLEHDEIYTNFIAKYKTACDKKQDRKLIKLLESTTVDIHTNHEFTLRWAAKNGCTKTVKYLLGKGADIHAWNDEALFWAIDNYRATTALELLKNGANPIARGKQEFNRIFNEADTPPLRDWILNSLRNREQEKYPFSSQLKPSVGEKYSYYTNVKYFIKSKDNGGLTTELFDACKKGQPWIAHQILKQKTLPESILEKAFNSAACKEYYNRHPQVVHVLLEHGLHPQKATEKYYLQWLGSTIPDRHKNKNTKKTREVMQVLESFGGSKNIARGRHLEMMEKVMAYPNKTKKTKPRGRQMPSGRRFPY